MRGAATSLHRIWPAVAVRARPAQHHGAEAAASFGVSVRTYRKYEAGKRPRDGSFGYLDFAYTFDVEPAWLLGIKGFEPPRFRLRVV
jgi:hypothetical protein